MFLMFIVTLNRFYNIFNRLNGLFALMATFISTGHAQHHSNSEQILWVQVMLLALERWLELIIQLHKLTELLDTWIRRLRAFSCYAEG